MDTDPAMNLIMQPDLDVWLILTAGKLHAIHADVRPLEARLIGIFGVNERQRDERPAIVWPRFLLWQLIDGGFVSKDGTARDNLRSHLACDPWRFQVFQRLPQPERRIDLQLDEPPHVVERVAKEIMHPLNGAE